MSDKTLSGKVVIVTGAGGTLCSEMAKDLARQGASLALMGRTLGKLQTVADAIEQAGGVVQCHALDVNDMSALKEARAKITSSLGTCDILINGVGGKEADTITDITEYDPSELTEDGPKGFFKLDMDAFEANINLNLMGAVRPSQVFGVDMAAKGRGSIINFASMTSYHALPKVAAYSASKAAIVSFTEWLAAYLAPSGVRVNAIAPGFFVNDRSRKLLYNPDGSFSDRGAGVIRHTPTKRFGEAKELLGCMNWLIDDEAASFVTGITIPVDGGFLASAGL